MQAAVALAAFNLVCQVSPPGNDVGPRPSAETITYRVDPMLGRWCSDPCMTTRPIAALSEIEVVFVTDSGDFVGPFREVIRVRLMTGAYTETAFHPNDATGRGRATKFGDCERTRFGGFPPGSLMTAGPLIARVPTRLDDVRPAATPR
jgi:hypothetical protein